MGKPTEEQRPVIENASANNMVIAAPGSGKSFTMIEAVISILKKYPYARIGMVTFTRAATNALAAKLQKRLSKKDLDRVLVDTFHGLVEATGHDSLAGKDVDRASTEICHSPGFERIRCNDEVC